MGWEERSGRSYYYRKQRDSDGNVSSIYIGPGRTGEIEEVVGQLKHIMQLRQPPCPTDAALLALLRSERTCMQLAQAHLLATGHRTHRGQWRRKRQLRPHSSSSNTKNHSPRMPNTSLAKSETSGVIRPVANAELTRLLSACNHSNPKPEDVQALRDCLRRESVDTALDMRGKMREVTLSLAVPNGNSLQREVTLLRMERAEEEMLEDGSGPVERLLATQIVSAHEILCVLQRSHAELLVKNAPEKQVEAWDKRVGAAQKRLLRACESLERVRRLKRRGPVQINVAATGGTFQQVNQSNETD